MKAWVLIFFLMALSGCATSSSLWKADIQDDTRAVVLDVPFVAQEKNMCGPVVLKMATHFSAPQFTLNDLKEMTFREEAQGTFQSDILSASRRMGLTPYRVSNSADLWSQIRDGRPVIVFQNMGVSWLPAWHFSLVVGYNAEKDQVLLHSGTEPYQPLGLKRFLSTWNRGDRWSYVVTQSEDIPRQAPFEEALENALLFEKIGNPEAARRLYQAMSPRFPERFEPHLGLAQLMYAKKNLRGALSEMEKAVQIKPDHPALLFNLSVLNFELGQVQKARELKIQTLARASQEERADYEKRFTF